MTDPLRNRQPSAVLAKKKNFFKMSGSNLYQLSAPDSPPTILEQERIAEHVARSGRQKHDSHIIREERAAFRKALDEGAVVEDGPHRVWIEKRFQRGHLVKVLQIY